MKRKGWRYGRVCLRSTLMAIALVVTFAAIYHSSPQSLNSDRTSSSVSTEATASGATAEMEPTASTKEATTSPVTATTLEASTTRKANAANRTKTILLWTTWYEQDNGFDFGYGPDKFRTCPVASCQLTSDRSLFNKSAAVMFQTQADDWNATDLPTYRFTHQRFINYNYEPQIYTLRSIYDSVPPHFFNWTYTYRRDSDIVGFRYGIYRLVPESVDRSVWTGNYDQEESLDDFYGVNITRKSIAAAWFVSHCTTAIGRENYVAELQKHIRVDIYGKCKKNFTCYGYEHSPLRDACDKLLSRDYLFYLAFENNFCPDYATEKLFRGFLSQTVPVVLGGAHYTRFAPPHSYINVLDYESPQQLAEYLVKLSENRKLYAHYHEWRRHFRITEKMPIDSWCHLCRMLHDPSLPAKSYANITKWWFDDYPCDDHSWKKSSFRVPDTQVES